MAHKSLTQFLETTNDAAFLINSKGLIIDVNTAACEMFKYNESGLIGENIKIITPSPIREKHDGFLASFNPNVGISHVLGSSKMLYAVKSDDTRFPVEVGISFYEEENERYFVGLVRDQTEKQKYINEVKFFAEHDVTTNLLNRRTFVEKIGKSNLTNYIAIHLHGLAELNHNYGSELSDHLLAEFANGLSKIAKSNDLIARISASQFAIASNAVLESLIENLNTLTANPFHFAQQNMTLKCSLGAASAGKDITTLKAFSNAEKSLRVARNESANHCVLYDSNLVERFERERLIIEEIPHVLKRGEFSLAFQPKVTSDTHKVTGAEVLIRWNSPKFGFVSPGEFIPIAEKSGLIADLDGWVFKETVKYLAEIKETGRDDLQLAVNLSALNLSDPELNNKMKAVLGTHNVSTEQINIEVTETAIGESVEVTSKRLKELKALGFSISIDDFGTGYSSLSYLADFPFDYLKIDQSFVRKLPQDKQSLAIAQSIINLANGLNLKTIVEGIETKEQAELLTLLGADLFQGYYFARPMTKQNFTSFISRD